MRPPYRRPPARTYVPTSAARASSGCRAPRVAGLALWAGVSIASLSLGGCSDSLGGDGLEGIAKAATGDSREPEVPASEATEPVTPAAAERAATPEGEEPVEAQEESGDEDADPLAEGDEGSEEGEAIEEEDDDDPSLAANFTEAEESIIARAAEGGIRTPAEDRFFDVADAPIRARLAVLDVAKVKRGSGGRSLGFKIHVADGTKGYFKAEQTFSAANWNSEVAAYHLDRMLGLHRVPPVVSRSLPWKGLLQPAAGSDKRREEIIVQKDGTVRGAFVWWIPGGLRTWPDFPGWEKWIRVRGWPSTTVSPMQRPARWAHQLRQRRKLGDGWITPQERHRRRNFDPSPDRPDRPEELSDMIVFDYLTKNIDRWGGRNANVLVRGKGEPLVFLDNGAGFAAGRARPSLVEARLHVLQRFRRSTVRALRSFDMARYKERLDGEPLAPILDAREIRHLKERHKALLDWVRTMQRRYGERATPWE